MPCDKWGHHALHCKVGGGLYRRHNVIRDAIRLEAKRAGFETFIEQKFEDIHPDRLGPKDEINEVIDGIPGDVMIPEYWRDGRENTAGYFDVTVVNIFADSMIEMAKTPLGAAIDREKRKKKKYKKHPNVVPLAIETAGGVGPKFVSFLRYIANEQAHRKSMTFPFVMERVRANIIAKMIRENATMYLNCMDL